MLDDDSDRERRLDRNEERERDAYRPQRAARRNFAQLARFADIMCGAIGGES